MREIEKANPDTLYGVFGDAQWSNKERLSDALLKDLIEHFSKLPLGNGNVTSDLLGDAYEYLIKKFADATKYLTEAERPGFAEIDDDGAGVAFFRRQHRMPGRERSGDGEDRRAEPRRRDREDDRPERAGAEEAPPVGEPGREVHAVLRGARPP